MPRLSREEKIARLEQQKKEIEAQKRQLLAQQNAEERKKRTKRLIEIGAIALKYFNLPDTIEPEDFKKFIYNDKQADKYPQE